MSVRTCLTRMELRTLLAAMVSVALLIAACTPAATPSPTAAPAKPAATAAAKPAAQPTTASTAAPAAKPAAASVPGVPADWEKQWNDLIAAAKKEGKVVVQGPPNADTRAALSEAFKKRFGIDMEYGAAASNEMVSRLNSERAAGIYSTDGVLAGADSMMKALAASGKVTDGAMGMLAPLRPELILPDALDPSKYRNGKLWFSDPQDQYILRLSNYAEVLGSVNTETVAPSALTTLNDFVKPEYKGKLAAFDPTIPGRGIAVGSALYALQGEDFLRELYVGQQVFLARDQRQLGDLLAKGSYPITLGLERAEVDRLLKDGFKIADLSNLPGYTGAGFGLLGLVDKAPHPNAAKVFVNWMASKEGAQVFQEAQRHVTVRNDIDTSSFQSYVTPQAGRQYVDTYEWSFVLGKRTEATAKLQEMLGRR